MTLNELKKSTEIFIRPEDAAEILKCAPQGIRNQAKEGTLPYSYIRSGNRTKIVRKSLLKYIEEGT